MCSTWISGFGLKNSLSSGRQQAPDQLDRRPRVESEQRVVLERVVRIGLAAPELVEEIGSDAARIEELLQLHRRQLANLLLGVVHAALLADARADLFHDLLDVHRI